MGKFVDIYSESRLLWQGILWQRICDKRLIVTIFAQICWLKVEITWKLLMWNHCIRWQSVTLTLFPFPVSRNWLYYQLLSNLGITTKPRGTWLPESTWRPSPCGTPSTTRTCSGTRVWICGGRFGESGIFALFRQSSPLGGNSIELIVSWAFA